MMPSRSQINGTFPGGALAAAQSMHVGLREQERAGRLMRDVQIQDNCTSQHHVEATFPSGEGASTPQTVSFGRIAFVSEPCMACGSKRLGLTADPVGVSYDPVTFFTVPCLAQVLKYTTDGKGFFVGATVLLFAVGAVPEGFRVQADLVFTGSAIRQGPQGA